MKIEQHCSETVSSQLVVSDLVSHRDRQEGGGGDRMEEEGEEYGHMIKL